MLVAGTCGMLSGAVLDAIKSVRSIPSAPRYVDCAHGDLAALLAAIAIVTFRAGTCAGTGTKKTNAPPHHPTSDVGRADLHASTSQAPAMPFGPLIKRYKRHLFGQGRDRWQALPCALISIAQPHYPQIDLTRVRYADSISTLHGGAIAWHYTFSFPGRST